MFAPPLYLSLGFSPASRKLRLSHKMEKQAAANAFKGLSTRVPFLKSAFCHQEIPASEPIRSEPCLLEKNAPEGHVFSTSVDAYRALFRLKPFWDDISRFNSVNAGRGLQAVPLERLDGNQQVFRVCACEVSYDGDLRIARIIGDESDLKLAGGGMFSPTLYEIFLRSRQELYPHRFVMVHELEHAQHHSLWHLSGFPFLAFNSECAEYLAMLKTLIDFGEAPQLLAWRNEYIQLLPVGAAKGGDASDGVPHDKAANRFVRRLISRYGMSEMEAAMGIAWTFRKQLEEQYGQMPDQSFAEQFARMRNAAMNEYSDTYASLFGMHIDDLKDVVSRLSLQSGQ